MNRSKVGGATLAALIVILLVLALAGATMWFAGQGDDGNGSPAAEIAEVQEGGFDITVPVSGELAALRQEEIRNQLESRATIMEIVAEGSIVEKGELLLRLNDDVIVDEIKDAQLSVEDARTDLMNAESTLDIRHQERDSELKAADLDVYLKELALDAWRQGEEITTRQELELAIETAEKNYVRLADVYEKSVELAAKKFVSEDEMRQDEISMIEARARLQKAKLQLKVYEDFTYEQDKATKESDLSQAQDKRQRVEEEYDAKVRIAQNDYNNRVANLANKEERLEKLQDQLGKCVIIAPTDGLVVYASSLREGRYGRNEGQPPQVGTELSRNERIMVIPDVSAMVAEVKVAEALSGLIRPGQQAVVYSDAKPERPIAGEVIGVGVMAESGGWRDPNRRDYTVRVLLQDTEGMGLKPSMRCKADLYVGRVDEATYVPVQAVFRSGPISYVHVPVPGGYAQRQVTLGRASELYVEVLSGVEAHQRVLLREPSLDELAERIDFKAAGWDPSNGNGNGMGPGGMPGGANGGMRPGAGGAGGGEAGGRPKRPGGDRSRGEGGGRPHGGAGGERPSHPTGGDAVEEADDSK